MSNEESKAIPFQSAEVLMDAWETGQQLARRWGSQAVRSQVRSSRNAEPFTYSWWRTQGALAYLGALPVTWLKLSFHTLLICSSLTLR